jgi:excisionase family DNA binding protein
MEPYWCATERDRQHAIRSYTSHSRHYRRVPPQLRPRERIWDFLTVQQFADHFSIPTDFVRRLIRCGQLHLVQTTHELRIPREDLYAYSRARWRWWPGTILTVIEGGRSDQNVESDGAG